MRSEPPTGDELTRLLVSMKRNVLEQVANEPAPQKRSTIRHRIIGLTLGVGLLFGLGAGAAFALGVMQPLAGTNGAAAPSSPTPSRGVMPTPTTPPPSEYAVVPGQPVSRYGLACDTLVDNALATALFTTEVAPADPIVTASGVGIALPRLASIFAEGGTVCEWSNGGTENSQYGWNPAYVGVTVSILPRPADGWSEKATLYGMPSDYSSCGDTGCTASAAVGDAWVTVEASGGEPNAVNAESWQGFVDAVIAAVTAAGPAAGFAQPEQTAIPFADCEAILPVEVVRSITATPDAEPMRGGGGWSDWAEARLQAGNDGCSWSVGDNIVADVDWVINGRWAYERMLPAGTAEPLDLAGLGADDTASLRCDPAFGPSCAVDLRIGQHWLNVYGNDEATAIALAEAVLAQLAQ